MRLKPDAPRTTEGKDDFSWEGSFTMKTQVSEAINGIPSTRILDDGEHFVMRDVVLLSEFSKNVDPGTGKPRRYTKETQTRACQSFEGLQVNVNHPRRLANGQVDGAGRDVLMTLGKVTHPRLREAKHEGKKVTQTIGDLVLIKGPASDHIIKLAKLDPKLAGMSLTGDCVKMTAEGEYANVEGLLPVTVDVVHRPATTKGFFEGVEEHLGYYGPHDYKEYAGKSRTEMKKMCEEAEKAASDATAAAAKDPTMENHTIAGIKHERSAKVSSAAAAKALQDADMEEFKEYGEKAEHCRDASSVHRCLADHAKEKMTQEQVEVTLAKLSEEFGEQAVYGMSPQVRHDPGAPDADDERAKDKRKKKLPAFMAKGKGDAKGGKPPKDDADDADDDEDMDDDEDDSDEADEGGGEEDGEEEGDGDEEAAEDEKSMGGDGEAGEHTQKADDQITREADELTIKTKVDKTPESHVAAMFAHAKAAGLLYERGNVAKAMAHLDTVRAHESKAEQLAQQQKPTARTPSPPGGVRTPSTMQSPKYEGANDQVDWLKELYTMRADA